MTHKSIWAVAALLLVGVSFWAGNYSHDYLLYAQDYGALSKLPTLIGGTPPQGQGAPVAPTSAPTTPVAPVSTGPVRVTAITPTSITVQTGFNKTKTFAISSDTLIYSAVLAGQTGKGLSDIKVGGAITVNVSATDPGKASSLVFVRDPSFQLAPEESIISVTGNITNLTGSAITIMPSGPAPVTPVTVTFDASTKIITQVTAGQQGRSLSEGIVVTASGLMTAGGKTTAKLITIGFVPNK